MKKFTLLLTILLFSLQANADTLLVGTQYTYIQEAIDNSFNGDIIIVSPGTYRENINFGGRAITVTSTDPDNPVTVAATIIDGNNPTDPNFGSTVIFNSGEDTDSVLTGFTITGGTGSWLIVSWEFKGKRWNRCGGGVLCYNMSQPTITKNLFTANSAGQGGGIYIYGNPVDPNNPSNPPVHISPIITDNTFTNNIAIIGHGFTPPDINYPNNDHGDGGAIVGFQGVDADITGNLFESNFANWYGGGLHLRQWSNGIIKNNQVISNASPIGAGIHVTYSSSPQIIDNRIEDNQGSSGAAIYVYYLSKPIIVGNLIRTNSSRNGIFGVHFNSGGQIKNNLIAENTEGSAIILTGSSPWICHNTIVENEKTAILCNGSSSPKIENNIVALNYSGFGIEIGAGSSADPNIRYNNIWNNELGDYSNNIGDLTGTAGNISADPQFLNEPNLMVHLNYTSPCIGTGDPNFVPAVNEVDFDGNPRVLNIRTDIGSDEVRLVWNITKLTQYDTIQHAIDDANDLDTIVVLPDRYPENIDFNGRSVTVRSLEPTNYDIASRTIIDGNDTGPVITFSGTEDANCVLTGFTITDGNNTSGGGINGNGTGATISFCKIISNTANQGGGIYDCDGLIANNRIIENSADTFGGGLADCDGLIANNWIIENSADTFGGGMANCDGQIINSAIADNQSVTGGGLYNCTADIINDTIVNNVASANAGGLYNCSGLIANSIVWDNNAPAEPALENCSTPSYSCLQSPIAGLGNIYIDPQFVDANNSNYHLTIYSDCIDAGDNNSVGPQSVFDIDKDPRLFTFDPNKIPTVDIGADEVLTSQADFDDNGIVDYLDGVVIAEEWLTGGAALRSDLAVNEFIDFNDYILFANDWLWQGPWHRTSWESALQFNDSSDGYVWIHTPEGCILNNVFTFTYTAWIYPLSFNQVNARIIGKNERALMTGPGGTLIGYSHGGGTAYSFSFIGSLQTDKWQFVMMIYDYYNGDKKVHLYVDGKEVNYQVHTVGTESVPPFVDWRTEGEWDLMIGSRAWVPGAYIPDAIIDEVAIYDRVLTQEEINYLYNTGLGRPTPLSMNPIGLWHLDEKQGVTTTDSSGNNNHGLLQGSFVPAWVDGRFLEY